MEPGRVCRKQSHYVKSLEYNVVVFGGGRQSQGRGRCRKREGKALFSTLESDLVGVILILLLWGPQDPALPPTPSSLFPPL